jgi:prolipoprotein diacylglyceryltransferase
VNAPWPTVVFSFDPSVHLLGLTVRAETVATAFALLAGIVWAGVIAGRTTIGEVGVTVAPVRLADEDDSPRDEAAEDWSEDDLGDADEADDEEPPDPASTLRRDDLLFIVLGAIPGAVLLGRIGYGLLHLDWYGPNPRLLLDLSAGSGELTLAVLGGTLTGIYVAALLDAPVSRWLHVAIRPLLLALVLAKLGQVLGGSGQGSFVLDGSVPTFAFVGAGPWGSPGPAIAAVPSQVYEALVTLLVLVAVGLLGALTPLRAPDGRLFAVGLGLWAFGRGLVATSWRDGAVVGTLKAEQVICLAVAAVAFSAATAVWAWGHVSAGQRKGDAGGTNPVRPAAGP